LNIQTAQLFGFLNVNKPGGKTAHDVVAIVRRLTKVKQVGHAGTLDPMATGVLPIAVGKACRLLRFLEGGKTYLAEIRLGQRTNTDDIEGETIASVALEAIPEEAIVISNIDAFRGTITQVPPLFSAIHIGGKRLYELARAGEVVENIPERTVEVKLLEVVGYEKPVLTVRIACSAGTYIRSIARDLGEKLGCGGCLQALVRETAGPFNLGESYTVEQLQSAAADGSIASLIAPPEAVLTLQQVQLSKEQAAKLKLGQAVTLEHQSINSSDGSVITLNEGAVIAVCRHSTVDSSIILHPEVVFN
jgi:tRNA pseudouridine55 synthase